MIQQVVGWTGYVYCMGGLVTLYLFSWNITRREDVRRALAPLTNAQLLKIAAKVGLGWPWQAYLSVRKAVRR